MGNIKWFVFLVVLIRFGIIKQRILREGVIVEQKLRQDQEELLASENDCF